MEDARMSPSQLILEDGSVFEGFSPEWQKEMYYGEVVFTTGMTGYCESLTDPSYAGQILVFTYPLIGNYGVIDKSQWESQRIHVRGVIVSEVCMQWSHTGSIQSLLEWLQKENIPLISGIDTRQLTIQLRTKGVMLGVINCTQKQENYVFKNPHEEKLVAQVSIKERKILPHPANANKKIIVVDCGIKENILRSLMHYPFIIHQVPYDTDYTNEAFDGVFVSNGPGDPAACHETIAILKKAMEQAKPIYGVCLGAQIMALAAGGKTYKLPFGHRSQNQPCIDNRTQNCYITTQNHGYAIDEESLPKKWDVSFTNLNDNTIAGIFHRSLPFSAVQFHPEACPGPTDTKWFFDQFYKKVCGDHA